MTLRIFHMGGWGSEFKHVIKYLSEFLKLAGILSAGIYHSKISFLASLGAVSFTEN